MPVRPLRAEPLRGARAAILLLPLSLLLCAACGEDAVRACTMIGCDSGVTVELASLPSAPYSVELTPLDGPSTIKECLAADACGTALFFEGVSADSVVVKVTSPAGEAVTRAKAEYALTRPNGPQCDPECRQARVAVAVPD